MTHLNPEADIVEESPFHQGEVEVQQRVGIREKIEGIGRKSIRSYMPDQHREFFTQLPMLLVGSVDDQGQPWASVLCAQPGFISSPDAGQLIIKAKPLHADPLSKNLRPDRSLGLLGIELPTRRRNRMNGTVSGVNADGFTVRVKQSFGNCPKYIQTRSPHFIEHETDKAMSEVIHAKALNARMLALVSRADTYFIASVCPENTGGHDRFSVDVSHRGGKPGFVRADNQLSLTAPEFIGNFFFNTTGNIQAYPRAGLLFIDFDRGDLLYLAVDAEIIWDGPELLSYAGAQRLLRYHICEAILVENSLPLRWGEVALSPFLEPMGSWPV